jgi:hypothetical protein
MMSTAMRAARVAWAAWAEWTCKNLLCGGQKA